VVRAPAVSAARVGLAERDAPVASLAQLTRQTAHALAPPLCRVMRTCAD
jgi:hypothetical protein